jgi:hypothetical protein
VKLRHYILSGTTLSLATAQSLANSHFRPPLEVKMKRDNVSSNGICGADK